MGSPLLIDRDSASNVAPALRVLREGDSITIPLGTAIATAERLLVVATLDHCDGDKRRAARTLGISLKTLYNRLHEYADDAVVAYEMAGDES